MSLQEKIIYQYRQHYPQDTLRDISARTKIQLTRIFRLLNGKRMKLEEYEAFHTAIKNNSKRTIISEQTEMLYIEINVYFSLQDLGEINEYLARKIFIRKMCPTKINYNKYIKSN